MPLYTYQCDRCTHREEDVYEKMTPASVAVCPTCGPRADGSYHRVPTVPHTDLKEFHTPIEMYSIALDTDEEIRDFKARAPDVDICSDPASDYYGVPIARSRAQKMQALKATGFIERN